MKAASIILVLAVVFGFSIYVILSILKTKWHNKVIEAREIADLAISGKVNLDEHDIKLAIDILQTEWEKRKLSGNDKPHKDSVRITKMLDFYVKT